ncbi:MAG: ribonuclease P protein component [Saprospiraceae bacterium]|nr:ribonuclease P protein component [Saprospiraceae bacterium]
MPAPRTFSRSERLKSAKVIASLFKSGQSLMAYPLRVVWVVHEAAEPEAARLAISVSKRLFKTAVQRNRIKRQIREAYRLNKDAFYRKLEEKNVHISLMLIYIAKEPLPYAEIDAGIKKMIRKFE